jgi:isoleucyl-tRNA synthetase
MRRVPEVIDCWFDSGSMPVSQSHYPFENETLLEDGRFPADYICEAIDQTRGWFYSLHALSTMLFDRNSFKNVICHGHILDAKGEKMSKSKGNMVKPWDVVNKYGADALRWYIYTAVPMGNSMRFEESAIQEISRRFLSTLWNTYSFFVMYANIDDFKPDANYDTSAQSELDRWIYSELNQLIADVDSGLEKYDPRGSAWKIAAFVDILSNWYVRRSRRRFWKSENDTDKLSAYNTLYTCLVTVAKLLAPFTPFISEELYQNLVCTVDPSAPESVHLADFPAADMDAVDEQLIRDVSSVTELVSKVRALRTECNIKVRQPISSILMPSKPDWLKNAVTRFESEIKDEVNIKGIDFVESLEGLDGERYPTTSFGNSSVAIDTLITPELKAEGMAREIVRRIQTMRRSAGFEIADHIETFYEGDDFIKQVMTEPALAEYIKQETLSQQLTEGVPEETDFSDSYKLSGYQVKLGVKKL